VSFGEREKKKLWSEIRMVGTKSQTTLLCFLLLAESSGGFSAFQLLFEIHYAAENNKGSQLAIRFDVRVIPIKQDMVLVKKKLIYPKDN
jgi:hypothetical protein